MNAYENSFWFCGLDAEARYLFIERIGILCGSAEPTPEEIAIAREQVCPLEQAEIQLPKT